MSAVEIEIIPRRAFRPYLMRKNRWSCIVAHRRAGKTVACIQDLIAKALVAPKGKASRFAYIAPFYAQAKDVAWAYLKQYTGTIPGATPNESELHVTFEHNGARIRLYGSDNYDRMRGIYLDGCILDENGDMDPRAWSEVIRPALSDRKGWATFIGTPKGRNAFYDIHQLAEDAPDWFSLVLRASQSGLIDAEELTDARRSMTPEQYEQEYECSFDAAIMGAYYATLLADADTDGRITEIEVSDDLPIHTAWDLGIGDSMAIWVFQAGPEGMRVIDYIEDHGKPIPHYVAELEARGYRGGNDFAPHDAKVRSLDTGRSRLETLANLGRKPILLPLAGVDDGINGVRQLMPRMWFDRTRCKQGLDALRHYRTEYDEKAKVFKKRPAHDWSSHAADAMRYAAQGYRDLAIQRIKSVAKPKPGQIMLAGPPEPETNVKRTRV
jgi:phage terminase large subunit